MRIITGRFKGRPVTTVRDKSVRPVMDRVKGTIFNVLQNRVRLDGANVLDLFAGSGSLGLEALSRGARHAVFVDHQRSVLDMIAVNVEKLGCQEECEIVQGEGFTSLDRLEGPFDLIFADPPYVYERTGELPARVFDLQLLKKDGFLIIEHLRKMTFQPSLLYELVVQKQFGTTSVSFFTGRRSL